MGTIVLNYDHIYKAAKHAKNVAESADDYVSALQKKIINKIDDLKGSNTTYTSNTIGNVNDKITKLQKKSTIYTDYAAKLEKFVDDDTVGAKAIDKKVADLFKKDAEEFRSNNNMKINPVTQFFTYLSCGFSNSGDLARTISNGFSHAGNWVDNTWDSVKDWYRYEGGKYWTNIGKAIVCIGIAVAVIAVTVLTGGVGLVAICAIIGSSIAIIDGLVTCCENGKAIACESSDPAYALKLSKVTKFTTLLRKTDTGSKTGNTALSVLAGGIDIVEAGCAVVTIVSSVAELGKRLPAIKNLVGNESKGLLKVFLDKSARNVKGDAVVTFKSFRDGLKTLVTNPNVRCQIASKFKADVNFHFNPATIKDTIRYEWKFNIKQTATSLATSADARSRYAGLLKVEVGKNATKVWSDTVGKMSSANTIDNVKGMKNILKLTSTGLTNFSTSASSGDINIVSMSDITGRIKEIYKSMDSKANNFSEGMDNIKSIKESIGSISEHLGNIKPVTTF
ncbi:hypothetical protein [Anaerosporobacter faecicola]|uniref:hypothetical protein n=1 Tax=Anaerosporobacter faecicola TaxID=2718714 RepID=UPI00143AE16C|nr:hypothetical protein [Anaerosporobacter faecicola]